MAEPTVDKVQVEIEAKASKANDVLDQLAKNLGNVKRALTGFDTSALDRIQKSLDSIETKAQAVSKTNVTPNIDTSKICTSERKISNSLENIQDKFARLSNLANAAMGGDTSALTSFKRQATSLQGDLDVLQGKLQRLGETRPLSQAWQDTIRQEKEVEDRLSILKAKMNDVMSGKTTMSGNAFQKLQEYKQ
jgi:septation ring formation regulator EzrA